jgi:hypothetical protein
MNDYIKKLESHIEQLQEKLAVAELKMPEWKPYKDKCWHFLLGKKVFGYVEYMPENRLTRQYRVHDGNCNTRSTLCDNLEDAKMYIEKSYISMFLFVASDSDYE